MKRGLYADTAFPALMAGEQDSSRHAWALLTVSMEHLLLRPQGSSLSELLASGLGGWTPGCREAVAAGHAGPCLFL